MPFRIAESGNLAVVKVVGIGGGGGNAINTMVESGLQGVEFIAANTDRQALDQSKADVCLQLGPSVTEGLGAGADPEVGKQAALESTDELKDALRGSDMVFVTAGLGGGTGTGAAPVVAKLSKELGILTVAIVTKPFAFEGKLRMKKAIAGWEELRQHIDTIITIPNDRLLTIMTKSSKLKSMMTLVDDVLLQAVKGISDLISAPGLINVDFADLRKVMKEVGPAIMGAGSAVGENRAMEAAKQAIDNQLLEDVGIDGARGLLINISATEDSLGMKEFQEASMYIQSQVDDDAEVVIGVLFDENLGEELHITVIATDVGDMTRKKKTIATVDDLVRKRSRLGRKSDRQPQDKENTEQAHAHKTPDAVVKLPSSSFDSYRRYGADQRTIMSRDGADELEKWDKNSLDTPTYLRKKAN